MTSTEDLIRQYQAKMYQDPFEDKLRPGDVVGLDLDDFSKIVRNESILPLFADYYSNSDYSHGYWAILNKSCDMIHDDQKGRYFSSNLFVAPLQSLRSAISKGTLGNITQVPQRPSGEKTFLDNFKKFFTKEVKHQYSKAENENAKEYGQRVQGIARQAVQAVEKLIEGSEDENPEDILNSLIHATKDNADLQANILKFDKDHEWQKSLTKYKKKIDECNSAKDKIALNRNSINTLTDLTLNQMDSKGIFFYEPSPHISSPDNGLSFLIQLEDMTTIKINREMQQSGGLFQLLKSKRIASLTRNFSDRLLNIMGNYFSKIGTPDVLADEVLDLYRQVYKDEFVFAFEDT